MTQPAVIFSNYDGAHTADRAANNTIPALPKWKGRQSGRKKEAAEVCCLSLLFWVKICDAQQQTATATANIAGNQNLNTELTKNKPKKKRHFFIYFNYFQVFLGFFVLPIARFCKQGQTQSEPVGFSLGKQQKTFHAETWQSTANLTWTLPNRFHHGQKQQDQKTQSCLHLLLWMKPEMKYLCCAACEQGLTLSH